MASRKTKLWETRLRLDHRGRFAQVLAHSDRSAKDALARAIKMVLVKWDRIPYLAADGGQSVVVRAGTLQVVPGNAGFQQVAELTLPGRGAGDKSFTRYDYGYLKLPLDQVAMLDELARAVRDEVKR